MTEVVVSLHHVACRLNQHNVLRIDNLQILRGQHWCIYGGNGAGKTLLVNMIRQRLPVSGGHLKFGEGFDPERDTCEVSFEEQQRLWQRENRHDISEFTTNAEDIGTTVAALIGLDDTDLVRFMSQDTAAAGGTYDMLRQLDVVQLLPKGIRYLSSGQLRRVMLARAFHRNPPMLILDNPLESIDRGSADRISMAIKAWMTENNNVMLLSRRMQDIVPGLTHLALFDQLTLVSAGDMAVMRASDEFRSIALRCAEPPKSLPAPCQGRFLPQANADQPLIALRGVDVAYGEQRVFQSLHWEMSAGQHVLIEGPNGSGKSTLLSLIDGDNHKAYGQPVYLFGRRRGSGETVWDIKARFGVVSNELHNRYIKGWRVLDVVVSGFFDSIGLYDDVGSGEIATARAWLATVALQDLQQRYYHELSYGQQRLVLLARAMVKQPLILILDEPLVGLDDFHRVLLLNLLDKIAQSGRTHLIYVSHTEGEAPDCITHRLTLHRGADMTLTQLSIETIQRDAV